MAPYLTAVKAQIKGITTHLLSKIQNTYPAIIMCFCFVPYRDFGESPSRKFKFYRLTVDFTAKELIFLQYSIIH